MLTQEQVNALEFRLERLDLNLRSGNVPNCELNINNLATILRATNTFEFAKTIDFITKSLKDPLFRNVVRTALPFFVEFIHSHQPKADEAPE